MRYILLLLLLTACVKEHKSPAKYVLFINGNLVTCSNETHTLRGVILSDCVAGENDSQLRDVHNATNYFKVTNE